MFKDNGDGGFFDRVNDESTKGGKLAYGLGPIDDDEGGFYTGTDPESGLYAVKLAEEATANTVRPIGAVVTGPLIEDPACAFQAPAS